MHHDERRRVDLDGVASAHNDGSGRHSHAVNDAGRLHAICGQLAQSVVDQEANTAVAAVGIDADCEVFALCDGFEIGKKFILADETAFFFFASPRINRPALDNSPYIVISALSLYTLAMA